MSAQTPWHKSVKFASLILAVAVAQAAVQPTRGATLNWVGTVSGDISDSQNYDAGVVVTGNDLVFGAYDASNFAPGTLGMGISVNSLKFANSVAVTLGGANGLTLGVGGMSFDTGSLGTTINVPVILGASQTWTNLGANTTINGVIDVGSYDLTMSGVFTINSSATFNNVTFGTMTLNGSNTYNGVVTLNGTTVNQGANVFNRAVQINTGYFNSGSNTFNDVVTVSGRAGLAGTSKNTFKNTLQINGVVDATDAGIGNTTNSTGTISFGNGTTFGAQSNLTFGRTVTLAGTTDFYTNGHSIVFNTGVNQTSSTSSLWFHTNATISFTGSANDANLSVVAFDNQTIVFDKASSSGVHAVERTSTFNGGTTLKLAGTGGDQIKDTASVQLNTGATMDMNGRSEGINMLNGGGTVTNNAAGTTSILTLGTNNDNPLVYFTGTIQDGAGKVGLAKTGSNTLSINAPTVFTGTGGLTVSGGTLTLDYASYQNADIQAGVPTELKDFVSSANTLTLAGGKLQVNGHGSAEANDLFANFVAGAKVTVPTGTATLAVGQTVSGGGLPDNTYIVGVPDAVNIYLNHAPTTNDQEVELIFGAVNTTTSQTFAGVNLQAGNSSIGVGVTSGINNGVVLNLGGINRQAGATVDFSLPSGEQTLTNGITTTTANSAGTILGGWATVNGTDWAVSNSNGSTAGNITAFTGYSNDTYGAGVDTNVTTANTLDNATSNSLRFSNGVTLTLSGINTVTSGGILVSKNVGANPVTISGGTLVSGNGSDLIINTAGSTNQMTVASTIANNGAMAQGLTKSGTGTLYLTGNNTYTGATNIAGGTLSVANTSNLGVNSAVVLSGGASLTFTTGSAGGQLNLQGSGVVATASSNSQPATNAIDGKTNTRWETIAGNQADPSWIVIDLGQEYTNLSQVNIWWEAANAKTMQIQVAQDGTDITTFAPNEAGAGSTATNGWSTVLNVASQNPATNKYTSYFLPDGVNGRYLAMYGTARNLVYGYSIWEMQVFQKVNAGNIVQSVGSLASSDATTSVNLPARLELSVGGDNTSTTFAGSISGAGMLQKVGTGNLKLTGTNTYNGGTDVEAGSITFDSASARPTSDVLTINRGAMAIINGGSGNINDYRTQLLNGKNGVTTGPVIRTTAGVATEGIGYLLGVDYNETHGTSYDPGAVVFKYAMLGDVNLDGKIDTFDFIQIDSAYLSGEFATGSNAHWVNGDFNYDGVVNALDYAILDAGFAAYSNNSAQALARVAYDATRFGGEYVAAYDAIAAVPEPATVGLFIVGALSLMTRRRR